MAYMIGPGGQPILMGQIPGQVPILPHQQMQPPVSRQMQMAPPGTEPSHEQKSTFVSEEKLQEKGEFNSVLFTSPNAGISGKLREVGFLRLTRTDIVG